jgi:hypothetical protein
MNAKSTMSPSWRRRLRTLIPAALGIGLSAVLATGMVSAVRKARNAAHSASTTFADGTVRTLPDDFAPHKLRAMLTANGGEAIPE